MPDRQELKMKLVHLSLTLILTIAAGGARPTRAQQLLPCPAVDAHGNRPKIAPLDAHGRQQIFLPHEQPGDRDIDEGIADKAVNVLAFFESDGGNPWATVSNRETISVGFMQWNWETRSLINLFFRQTGRDAIAAAPHEIEGDLSRLKDYSEADTPEKRKAASAVISSWVTAAHGDPLVKGVRKSVRAALGVWLSTPAMMSVQKGLMKDVLGDAFFYARAWRRDTGDQRPVDARLVTYFFDLLTFNGGTAGLWAPHVRQFRSDHPGRKAAVEAVAAWLSSCDGFISPKGKKLYALGDALKSAAYWKEKVDADENAFDDEQVDLLVLGLLRAQMSNGDDRPKGFHGIYQADVLTRRGVIAVGGYARGTKKPFVPF